MNWQQNVSNWISGGALEKQQEKEKLLQSKIKKNDTELEQLKATVKSLKLDNKQLQAQLQMSKGFQIELGETQVALQDTRKELEECQQKIPATKQELEQLRNRVRNLRNQLARSQDWLTQIKQEIKVTKIEKRLPKTEFDALWGFGLTNPEQNRLVTGGSLDIKGWVLGKKSTVTKIQLVHNKIALVESPVNLFSGSVSQRYPDISQARTCGFEASISVVNVPNETELEIQAILEDKTILPLCAIYLKR